MPSGDEATSVRPPPRLRDVDERQKRILSSIVGGLIGLVVTGFALDALIDDPMMAWIGAAVSFVALEAAVIYTVTTRMDAQGSVVRRRPVPRWFPRLLHVLGWLFLVVGALSFVGHVLVPDTAGTPELGAYGGWILDAMSLLFGAGALVLRKRLLARSDALTP